MAATGNTTSGAMIARRHVLYVEGYDPQGISGYARLFRRELTRTCKLWPIQSVVKWNDARAEVRLVDAKSPLSKGQFVELRLVEGKWTITSMR